MISDAIRNCTFSGVYCLFFLESGKFYVGSSIHIRNRVYKHLSLLRSGTHSNAHLRSAYQKYGESGMLFSMLEACATEVLLEREQFYIDHLKPAYNLCPIAGNTLGYRHAPEARAKMAVVNAGNQRMLGKKHSEEAKARIAAKATGRKQSSEQREKQRLFMLGNTNTLGRPLSESHRLKVGVGAKAAWGVGGSVRKQATSARTAARWADLEWKANQLAKIKAGRERTRASRAV